MDFDVQKYLLESSNNLQQNQLLNFLHFPLQGEISNLTTHIDQIFLVNIFRHQIKCLEEL